MDRSQAGEEGTDIQDESVFMGTNGICSFFTSDVVYASSSSWTNISQRNTGDTSVLLGISDPDSTFATSYADDVAELYSNGWAYGSESEISHIVRVEPIPENGNDVRPNTIAVTFQLSSKTGVLCQGQKIVKRDREYQSLLTLYMTWQDDHWIETQGSLITDASK